MYDRIINNIPFYRFWIGSRVVSRSKRVCLSQFQVQVYKLNLRWPDGYPVYNPVWRKLTTMWIGPLLLYLLNRMDLVINGNIGMRTACPLCIFLSSLLCSRGKIMGVKARRTLFIIYLFIYFWIGSPPTPQAFVLVNMCKSSSFFFGW